MLILASFEPSPNHFGAALRLLYSSLLAGLAGCLAGWPGWPVSLLACWLAGLLAAAWLLQKLKTLGFNLQLKILHFLLLDARVGDFRAAGGCGCCAGGCAGWLVDWRTGWPSCLMGLLAGWLLAGLLAAGWLVGWLIGWFASCWLGGGTKGKRRARQSRAQEEREERRGGEKRKDRREDR